MQDVEEVAREQRENLYRDIVTSAKFAAHVKTYQLYHRERQQKLVEVNGEETGIPNFEGMIKINWGTQKVIILKQEEPSWKRRSMKINSPMGSQFSIYNSIGSYKESVADKDDNKMNREEMNGVIRRNSNRKNKVNRVTGEEEEDEDVLQELQKRNKMKRRTMSFSGHMYSTHTSAFRPKYGTSSNLRISSKETTYDVITLLLRKFAVENDVNEFNLYSVLSTGESHEFKLTDFPLLKRIELGPDDKLIKIFLMERKTQEISLEVAQYLNMQIPIMQAILRKYDEEEEKLLKKIEDRYAIYRANLLKKISATPPPIPPKPKRLLAKYRSMNSRPPLPPRTYKPPPLPPKVRRTRSVPVMQLSEFKQIKNKRNLSIATVL